MKQSNDLYFSATKIEDSKKIIVYIRLNDQCKNGHQDFAITGDIYESRKPTTDRYHIAGGCIHDEIEKHFPEFIPFIRLHLCDYDGVPMHAVANGFYHLEQGFNNTKPESENFPSEYCEYYRITKDQFEALRACKNQVQYGLQLEKLGILDQWKVEAKAAIEMLENLTETTFINDRKLKQKENK
jgi:hypothetical protein